MFVGLMSKKRRVLKKKPHVHIAGTASEGRERGLAIVIGSERKETGRGLCNAVFLSRQRKGEGQPHSRKKEKGTKRRLYILMLNAKGV